MKKKQITYKKKVYYNPIFVKIAKFFIPLILLFMRVKIKCIKGKIPKKGPLLIAAHHEGLADQFIIGLAIKRRLFWVADTTSPDPGISLADQKFKKWLILWLGAIPIDKRNPKRNVNLFDYLVYLLKEEEAIVFFPEGDLRSERGDRKFGEFRGGVVRTAIKAKKELGVKIPILPIGLEYTKKRLIKDTRMRIGNPIYVKGNLKADLKRLVNRIKELS